MARSRVKGKAPAAFVIDGSIALSWFFADEANENADLVAAALAESTALVPALFHLEIANALVVGERRKRCTAEQSTTFLTLLAGLPIEIDSQTMTRAWSSTIQLARAHELTAYHAAYLELAKRQTAPLATHDEKLIDAAKATGVKLFKP